MRQYLIKQTAMFTLLIWPCLERSIEQSGTNFDNCTIQLLILSRRLRSTTTTEGHISTSFTHALTKSYVLTTLIPLLVNCCGTVARDGNSQVT